MDIPASPTSKGMFQFCQMLSADNFSLLSSFAQQSVASNPPVDVGDQPPNPGGLGGFAPQKLRAF
jgi:hypothetical protein